MKIQSKALEVNLACYHVDVRIDERYAILQEVFSRYYGLMDGLNIFLKELSHPYRNWQFIVREARGYSLDYFHLLSKHVRGPEAARLFVEIFNCAIASAADPQVKTDAVDNLLVFLLKIIKESGKEIERFMPLLEDAFHSIRTAEGPIFCLFVKSFYPLPKIGEAFLKAISDETLNVEPVNRLLLTYLYHTYTYWLRQDDPQDWFENESQVSDAHQELQPIFAEISHSRLHELQERLHRIETTENLQSRQTLKQLLQLDGYHHIVDVYRHVPQRLFKAGADTGQGNHWKLLFLFHIMNTSGLSLIHEEALRDINRTLSWLIVHEKHWNLRRLIQQTFSILHKRSRNFPTTALNCVRNMGEGVYKTDDSDLVNFFIESVIDLGFQAPMIRGVGDDWQIRVNPAHIQNIRTWLELIELNPKWSPRLLSVLIIHLTLSGVFIKDTDLFPRDITRFLNSGIGPVYNLAKQLTRLFPTYFNEIGAEGQLRDISTELDEITRRKDVLIHFLRKQSHVESSNRIIDLMEATLKFWQSTNKAEVEEFVPPNIYERIETEGPYIDGVHGILEALGRQSLSLPEDLLTLSKDELREYLKAIRDVPEDDLRRVELAVSLYRLLNQKYNLDFVEMDHYLAQLHAEAFPNLDQLKEALAERDLQKKLFNLLDYLQMLKKLILSPQAYEVKEDIYKKRHFTVDIPSMYGSYHELKFDALGLTFRIESLVNVLFEELIGNIDLDLITKFTFYQIYIRLRLFNHALRLDGISSLEIERQLELLAHSLEVKGLSFTQYLDIFKGFARAVKNIINDHFTNIHEENLTRVLAQIPEEQLLPKFLPSDGWVEGEKIHHRVSEIFFRELIAKSLGLQQLDTFLSRILHTLFHQWDQLPKDKLHQLLIYDPQKAMTPIDAAKEWFSGIIYLGNKGYNMVKLKRFGLPVPPGFIITTEVFRCREIIESYPPAEENFREQVAREITALEKRTGKRFGTPGNPLLFSVRSGSTVSQPGMMDTFLDVGINQEIAAGIAAVTGNMWFAWDNYRRFLQCYGMSFDMERDDFDAIIGDFKQRLGVPYKKDFSGEQMKAIALTYETLIRDAGIEIVDDPFNQLFMIIKRVLRSWESAKAHTYRKIMGISDDWGTAVTVQEMVYGNLSPESGSGVIFTHNPRWSGEILKLWGDFTIGNQGEDVVSGLVRTLPISLAQQSIEMRETDITLETHFPEIYQALNDWANELIYKRGWSPQEMEFTFEGPSRNQLYLLQTRDMAMRERKKALTFEIDKDAQDNFLGHGIGVSGGAMSGRMVFSLEEIDRWRDLEPETPLILVRGDTVPDDIREIYAADGLLTGRGGMTSHAAVVAHRLGKTCVVGCGDLVCDETAKMARIQTIELKSGDHLSIDGQEGSVYQGRIRIKEA